MNIRNAFKRRATLNDDNLLRLRNALVDEVERYKFAIANYPPERMEKYGKPYLANLENLVDDVDILIASRKAETEPK